jgi:hypothetical protein
VPLDRWLLVSGSSMRQQTRAAVFDDVVIVGGVHRSDPATPGRVTQGCSFGEQSSAGEKATSGEKKALGEDEKAKQQQQLLLLRCPCRRCRRGLTTSSPVAESV